jgi:hypothetical protein
VNLPAVIDAVSPPAVIDRKPWTPDQLAFQAWLAVPPMARTPRSQRALAAQFEIREATLSDWKRLPGFGDAVTELALEWVKAELAPILFAQVAHARSGSLEHAKWLFEVAGVWSPKQRHEHEGPSGGPIEIVIRTVDDRVRPDSLD